ncbi:MAG: glycoside hydrolase family 31 protein [Bacteroidales bacterium]
MRNIRLFIVTLTGLFFFIIPLHGQNPVVIGNARFTFYSESLVRLEYAEKGAFTNDSTLFATNRNPTYGNISLEDKGNKRYEIRTPGMRISYHADGFPFGQMNLRVYFDHTGKEKMWYMASEQSSNLGGPVSTLDGVGSRIPLQEGLLSRDGWYAIHDTGKELLQNGWLANRSPQHIQDVYLFVYGNDYKKALRDLQCVSGAVPMTRKYVHGSWYCRWWNYTADDYRDIVREYKEHDFPLDILVFDMGWHTQKEAVTGTGHAGMHGWTGYTWNEELIPDPASLIRELGEQGINVVLNDHPHDGIRAHEKMYPHFMNALGVCSENRKEPLFDAGNREYMNNFLDFAHGESDSMGIAFWWLDWQQDYVYPHVRGTNMKHLPWLNHLYFNHSKKNNLRGAGFSRWGGWGDHRYPIQFSGDAVGNWDVLQFQVELTATSGNAGCFFWAHDIGGFFGGNNAELYTRWTQFGLLNSSLRIHSVYDENLDRRPWKWGKETEDRLRNLYQWRSRLMPYVYSSVWQAHSQMLPLNRPLYIEYPTEKEAYENPQEFLFGDILLSAPICKPIDSLGTATQKVWFPADSDWFDLFTHKKYTGGQECFVNSDLDNFPLYVRGGYPLPMQIYTPRMSNTPLEELVLRCYPGRINRKNSYVLYEDDGISMNYTKGEQAFTDISYERREKGISICIKAVQGTYEDQPRKRSYRIELPAMNQKIRIAKSSHTSAKLKRSDKIQGYELIIPSSSINRDIRIDLSE